MKVGNLSDIRREASGHLSSKKREYLKDTTGLNQTGKIKTSETYAGA
jgi:hypothetical protein